MTEPTADIVRGLFAHLAETYGARVVLKGSSALMGAAGWGLGVLRKLGLRVPDPALFATRYVTTIGASVFVPFEVGVADPIWSLWDQLTTIAHECEHIAQKRRGHLGAHERDYLLSTPKRAHLEADAYRVNLELHHWRFGNVPHGLPHALANMLLEYGCSAADVAVTERHLRMSAVSVRQGAVISEASFTAIRWLDEHAPELRAPNVASRRPS